jgi:thiol-disulfide isomerase/thioredoxin
MTIIVKNDILNDVFPCVLYFTASWCGPCKKVSPDYEKLSNLYKNIFFFKIDVDENNKLSTIYDIKSMPTFFFFKSKDDFKKYIGANLDELIKDIKTIN